MLRSNHKTTCYRIVQRKQ